MKRKILNIGLAVAMMFYASSCGKDFLDVNTDPNAAQDASPELVLPAAITSTASAVGGEYAILGGIWSQYWTQNNSSNQYKTIDAFNLRPLDFNARWTEVYSGALNDYKNVRQRATAQENWNLNLIATLMEAYTFQVLADLYDQIPFDEALRGDEGIINPTYQGGQEVYDGLITRMNDALAKPIGGSATAGNNDVVFQGDMAQWVRFANTLKLKMYLRQTEVRPSVAQSGVQALYAAGGNFLEVSAAQAIWVDETSKRNPLYEQDQSPAINTNQNLKASQTFLFFLQDNEDPRLDALYLPGSGNVHRGQRQGDFNAGTGAGPGNYPVNSTSRPIISPTDPVYFISEAESFFLQAEAVARGWGSGDAEELYESGVKASFVQLGLESTDADSLLAGDYAYPNAGSLQEKLEAIITQKWVALAGTKQGLEAFLERNRTNIPKTSPVTSDNPNYVSGQFTYPIEGITGNKFAKRLIFPEFERTRNSNTPPQKEITVPVWWDVN